MNMWKKNRREKFQRNLLFVYRSWRWWCVFICLSLFGLFHTQIPVDCIPRVRHLPWITHHAAELGDYDEEVHTESFISEFRFVPNQTEDLEIMIFNEYRKCRGLNPAESETAFLNKAKWLDLYGVDMHTVQVQISLMQFYLWFFFSIFELTPLPHAHSIAGKRRLWLFAWPDTNWYLSVWNHTRAESTQRTHRENRKDWSIPLA